MILSSRSFFITASQIITSYQKEDFEEIKKEKSEDIERKSEEIEEVRNKSKALGDIANKLLPHAIKKPLYVKNIERCYQAMKQHDGKDRFPAK